MYIQQLAFKAHYRKQLVQHYIERVEKNEEQSVNLREALHMVKTAWDRVQVSTIVNCYRHVKILPSSSTDGLDEDDDISCPFYSPAEMKMTSH